MTERKPTLDTIDRDLERAGKLLDGVARKLRDAGFAPKRNIQRIGEALARVSAIQFAIYAARPDLLPGFLAGTKFGRRVLSNRRLERAAADRPPSTRRRRGSGGRSTAGRYTHQRR